MGWARKNFALDRDFAARISASEMQFRGVGPSIRAFAAYIPAALLLAVGIIGLVMVDGLARRSDGRYLVIAAPGADAADMIDILRSADGRLVQQGRFSNMAVAWSNRADFAARTRRSGAWLAIVAPANAGCYGLLPERFRDDG